MKKQLDPKKLTLETRTVRVISDVALAGAAGGATPSTNSVCRQCGYTVGGRGCATG